MFKKVCLRQIARHVDYNVFLTETVQTHEDSRGSILSYMSEYLFSSPEPSGSKGELIVYQCSGVRRCRCRRPFTMFKHHLL